MSFEIVLRRLNSLFSADTEFFTLPLALLFVSPSLLFNEITR